MATKIKCIKCKEEVELKDAKLSVSKNGRNVLKGTCSKCGTNVSRFVKKDFKL